MCHLIESRALRPWLPRAAVRRASLIRRIDRTPPGGVALITAAAGSGKSVLVRQWAAEAAPNSTVLMQLEARHDDAVMLVRDLIRATEAVAPDEFGDLGDLVPVGGGMLGSTVIDALVERLARLECEIVVVFEDLHRISNGRVVSDLGAMASALPTRVRMVVTSRWDPPWPLTRLRLDGRLMEMRGQDLAFGLPDAREMLNAVSGRSLSDEQAQRLVKRTDGWAAGLQLAGISLQDANDPDEIIDAVTGSDRSIGEYLLEEVVDQQDPEVRQFLLRTSILEWFTPELCDAVAGMRTARSVLDELEGRSLFLVRLEGVERFRYHHLFAELLRYRLLRDHPDEVDQLHRSASMWLLEHGYLMEAVTHLLAAGDDQEAYRVISMEGHQWFERGESGTLVKWLGTILDRDAAAPAAVAINLLAAQVAADESAAAAETHRHLMRRSDLSLGERLAAAALHALLVFRELPPEQSLKSALFVRANLPLAEADEVIDFLGLGGRDSVEVMAVYAEAWSHFMLGDLAASTELLRGGLTLPGCDYPMWRIYLLGALALVRAWSGHGTEASALATGAIGIAERFGATHHEAVTSSRLALALVHLNRLEVDRAEAHLALAAGQNASRLSSFVFLDIHRTLEARLVAVTEGPRRALSILHEPSSCVVEPHLLIEANRAFEAHLRIQAGELESARATPAWGR